MVAIFYIQVWLVSPWFLHDTFTKQPESGDLSDVITEFDLWKDQAEAEGWSLILSQIKQSDKHQTDHRTMVVLFLYLSEHLLDMNMTK